MELPDIKFTAHFKQQFVQKGFTQEQLREAIERPEKITDVRRFPGQKRYCGGGIAVVLRGNTAITVYLDGVVTPLREDQSNDRAALNSRRLNS